MLVDFEQQEKYFSRICWWAVALTLVGLALVCLSGCKSAYQPAGETIEVGYQVTVPCLGPLPTEPTLMPIAEFKALNDYQKSAVREAEHERLIAYKTQLKAATVGCK